MILKKGLPFLIVLTLSILIGVGFYYNKMQNYFTTEIIDSVLEQEEKKDSLEEDKFYVFDISDRKNMVLAAYTEEKCANYNTLCWDVDHWTSFNTIGSLITFDFIYEYLNFDYQIKSFQGAGLYLEISKNQQNWSNKKNFMIEIKGQNSGNTIYIALTDKDGERFFISFEDDFSGWKTLRYKLTDFVSNSDWQSTKAEVNGYFDKGKVPYIFIIPAFGEGSISIRNIATT